MTIVTMIKPSAAAGGKVRMEIVDITPGMAAAWLEKNIGNRPLKRAVVDAYARDMSNGAWQLTGDPIRFSASGRLIDGQHRLRACIAADVPFETLVIYGLDDGTQSVIDTNVVRSAADMLHLEGHRYVRRLAGSARLLRDIEAGSAVPLSRATRVTHAEIRDVVGRHPRLVTSCALVSAATPIGCHVTTAMVVHYVATHFLDAGDDADAFIAVFATGTPRYTACAAHATRERLLRANRATGTALTLRAQILLTLQAWNAFRQRRQMQIVKVPTSVTIDGLDRNKLRKGKP